MQFLHFNPNPEKPTPENPSLLRMPFFNFQAKPQNNPQNPFSNIQTHISSFLERLSHPPLPNSSLPLQTHLKTTLQNFHSQAKQAVSNLVPPSLPSSNVSKSPLWARINSERQFRSGPHSMSTEAIEERLAGIPVYALSKAETEFVLVAGHRSMKSLGFFCFKKEDAEALLEQMKAMEPTMRQGSQVVTVPLNKVFQLKVDGVAFRFIPDSHQITNALKVKESVGESAAAFSGVPVFQCESLTLSSGNKRYRPVFFAKEDLEKSLLKASRHQRVLNPAFRRGSIQVCVLEEIINGMKDSYSSKWKDVVFVPPGYELSTSLSE